MSTCKSIDLKNILWALTEVIIVEKVDGFKQTITLNSDENIVLNTTLNGKTTNEVIMINEAVYLLMVNSDRHIRSFCSKDKRFTFVFSLGEFDFYYKYLNEIGSWYKLKLVKM
jgi:hypothetical protein